MSGRRARLCATFRRSTRQIPFRSTLREQHGPSPPERLSGLQCGRPPRTPPSKPHEPPRGPPVQYMRIDHTAYRPANCASVIVAATGSRVKVKRHPTQDWGIALRGEFGLDKLIAESRRADSNRFPAHYE